MMLTKNGLEANLLAVDSHNSSLGIGGFKLEDDIFGNNP